MNTPSMDVSITSKQTINSLTRLWIYRQEPSTQMGMMSVVSSTSKSEMPSTPKV